MHSFFMDARFVHPTTCTNHSTRQNKTAVDASCPTRTGLEIGRTGLEALVRGADGVGKHERFIDYATVQTMQVIDVHAVSQRMHEVHICDIAGNSNDIQVFMPEFVYTSFTPCRC
jgi:hypothetical protein